MKKVHHIVLIKFKPGTATDVPGKLFRALAELKLPGILKFIGGPYASHEGLNKGYTHGFDMTFADAASRNVYLDHPDHEKIKQTFLPTMEDIVAFDFEE